MGWTIAKVTGEWKKELIEHSKLKGTLLMRCGKLFFKTLERFPANAQRYAILKT